MKELNRNHDDHTAMRGSDLEDKMTFHKRQKTQ